VEHEGDGYEDLFIGIPGQDTESVECGVPGYSAVEARGVTGGTAIVTW
jgi:hypothetical protein